MRKQVAHIVLILLVFPFNSYSLLWFKPCWQHSSSLAFPQGIGERTRRVEVRQLVGWGKDCYAYKQSKTIQCFPWADRCSAILRKQDSVTSNGYLGIQIPKRWAFFPPSFSKLAGEQIAMWQGLLLWLVLGCAPYQPAAHPQPASWGVGMEHEVG